MSKLSNFANENVEEVVEKLTTDEAISLIAGVGFWWTAGIPRLGVPSLKMSDGPNGVRGGLFFNGTPANCIPCATALGASWDPQLISEVGSKLLAPETKQRAASIILAPTCNIQRSPLGGRSFESFTEDPHLSGTLAAAYVNGIQSEGIASCIKHFVANDQEHERNACDSIVSDRAIREIYLYPFMLAQKHANPMAYMTAYNKVNGVHASENPWLLKDVLRGEWKSNAMVMSDWLGVYSVTESINASLDLEMPGNGKWRTPDKVNRSIQARKTTLRLVKERAAKVLELVKKLSATNAEVIDGDGVERWEGKAEDSALMRKIAAESIVLLKNNDNILPLKAEKIRKLAIIGPNAKATVISGGGSASLKASYVVTPYDGIVAALPQDVQVVYHVGAEAFKNRPSLDGEITTIDGKDGWIATFHAHDGNDKPLEAACKTLHITETKIIALGSEPEGITERWTLRLKGKLRPTKTDILWKFGLTVAGRAKLYIDGQEVIDNWTRQTRGESFFMTGTVEETGEFLREAGKAHEISVEFVNVYGPADGEDENVLPMVPGVQIGGLEVIEPQTAIAEAVRLAEGADAVVVIVGLNSDWESEGYDRKTLSLPGLTDELVERVGKANKNTVVVNQSGSAVTMPWLDSVAAVVQAWYGGNENGNAIADILFGKVNPSGKLSLTFPRRLEDVASYGHFGSENGRVRYSEDLYVGYKSYQHRNITPLFPFGFGLSYTSFKYGPATATVTSEGKAFSATVSIDVSNTGSVVGSEVVQLYVTLPRGHLTHPTNQLRGFSKIKDLAPGETKKAEMQLDKYAVSYWDDIISSWRADKGRYIVKVGRSSDKIESETEFVLESSFEWNGL